MLSVRTRTATAMALRDQLRRPLVPILLVIVPGFIVIWSVAITQATPRRIELPGGVWVTTTMKELHGPEMAKFSVAVVAALVGVFVMQSALQGDRRLVVAGFRARETVIARLLALAAATGVVVIVAALANAISYDPASWLPVIAALLLIGLIYASVGALAGALLDKLAATYLILFLVLVDLSVMQTPMFHATPARFAEFLPGYGPTRVMLEGSYSHSFNAGYELTLALAWAAVLVTAVYLVLRRALGTEEPDREPNLITTYPVGVSSQGAHDD
jgi:hypothetical protein